MSSPSATRPPGPHARAFRYKALVGAPKIEGPAPKPIVRAVRVSQALLDAAKAYKKATGTSFYALGFEAISERLKREGYLKAAQAEAGA